MDRDGANWGSAGNIGLDALYKSDTLRYPIQHGLIVNIDDLEKFRQYCFKDLMCIEPSQHPILLTESPDNSKVGREKEAEMMFEKFKCPQLSFAQQSTLSLYAAVPINEGKDIPKASTRLDFGGDHLTRYLLELLKQDGLSLNVSSRDRQIVRDIKEKLVYVSLTTDKDKDTQSYELPDGQLVNISHQLLSNCGEALFNPQLMGRPDTSFQVGIRDSIKKCDKDIQSEISKVVFCGATTMMKGFEERVKKEFVGGPSNSNIQIFCLENRQHLAWDGGCQIAESSLADQLWINKSEYDDQGARRSRVKHKKYSIFISTSAETQFNHQIDLI
ncbi:Hypothetical protein DFA_06453 [Cavenderia fasciculata]|uniref:Actin n=1 Tax=Cavenderia fasciculata TaxID=261658 RepID=F4PJ17_CACFS|nr:Hypothetical protein DFA_06453 [Cavenderia fasciculata]EGG24303.1 Hypothetical protein DFA_06453 [Cavenderia fasciculata]|eukprot:XP_004362154.1 Hypothetical protein DFA_06453 [Cavenderia fasciculata]